MPARRHAHQLLMLQSSPTGKLAGGPSIRQPNHGECECQGLHRLLKHKSLALTLASERSKCMCLFVFASVYACMTRDWEGEGDGEGEKECEG